MTQKYSLLSKDIRTLIERGDDVQLRKMANYLHPAAIARIGGLMEPNDLKALLEALDPQNRARAFVHFDEDVQVRMIDALDSAAAAEVVAHMPHDDRVDLINALPEATAERLKGMVTEADRRDIDLLGSYAEGTAGAVMTSDFAALRVDMSVAEAITTLRSFAEDRETVYYLFVLDDRRRLQGVVTLKDLIIADPDAPLRDLMRREVVTCRAADDVEQVANTLKEYDLLALPVLNGGDEMIGIVTFDDVLDVQDEEVTDDFHKMAPIGLMTTSLKDAGLAVLYRARVPWLLILVFMNIFSGAGIAYFEDTLAAMISLAFFLPLLIDSGGNAGSQSATLMVRALATGQVLLGDWLRLIGKEVAVALALGVSMALAVALVASVRAPDIVVVVAITMVLTVLFGSLIGMSLPFILTRLKLDPATASAPLVTSIADIGGVLIYFSIATWWLGDVIRAAAEANGM